jgi:hypothetical protein
MAALGAKTMRALVRSKGAIFTVSGRPVFWAVVTNSCPTDLATPSAEECSRVIIATSSPVEGTSTALMISINRDRLEA